MKAFVYDKKSSKMVACIVNVNVNSVKIAGNEIIFITDGGGMHKFDIKKIKSTTYQN